MLLPTTLCIESSTRVFEGFDNSKGSSQADDYTAGWGAETNMTASDHIRRQHENQLRKGIEKSNRFHSV